jgi:tRNA-(ms[2]io[6]A)-hydroxylase
MRPMTAQVELPLTYRTPPEWAAQVLQAPLALLNDHAYLEKKAAGNALELLNRWPEPNPPEHWVEKMTAIARDEVEHLALVTRLLARRGGRLDRFHKNPYANALRDLVRRGEGPLETLDRLMVSGLIEARSCERFALLAEHCPDAELARIYGGLWASERGHYLTFLDLASKMLGQPAVVEQRWAEMLAAEAEIIAQQPPGPRMHSGMAR